MAIARNNTIDKDMKVERVKAFKDGNIVFDITVNGVTIYGMKVVSYLDKKTGEKREFFAFPQRKGSDGNYYNFVYCKFTDTEVEAIEKMISDML